MTVNSKNSDVIDSTRVAQMKDQICTLFLLKQPKVILNMCYDAQCVCDTFKMSFTEKGRLIAVYCVVGPFATKNVTITKYFITSTTKVDEEL